MQKYTLFLNQSWNKFSPRIRTHTDRRISRLSVIYQIVTQWWVGDWTDSFLIRSYLPRYRHKSLSLSNSYIYKCCLEMNFIGYLGLTNKRVKLIIESKLRPDRFFVVRNPDDLSDWYEMTRKIRRLKRCIFELSKFFPGRWWNYICTVTLW